MGQNARNNAKTAGENAIRNLQATSQLDIDICIKKSIVMLTAYPHVLLQEEYVLKDMLKLGTATCVRFLDVEIKVQADEH